MAFVPYAFIFIWYIPSAASGSWDDKDGFGGRISDICETGKITSVSLDALAGQDVYIVAKDFSWTYVKTHETGWCGPYFCTCTTEAGRDGE